jgi:glycosyltransferase involved in cell wall biosynthesis
MPDPQPNVLLLADRFEARGSSAYTLRLADFLSEEGIDAQVVSADARLVPEGRREQLAIAEYPYLSVPVWGRVVLAALCRDLSEDTPDLVHVQSRSMLGCGRALASSLKRPLVLTVHDYLSPRETLRFDGRRDRLIIAVSESVRDELQEQTELPSERFQVIHSGVELPNVVDAPPLLDPDRVPVVGTAGPLEASKGLRFFLQAARQVLAGGHDTEFLVAGAGPEEIALRRLASELGISEKVTFAPGVTEFSTSLEAMDIFCLPSLKQGLGTIMLEAMACGRPVIASGVGGVYSVVRDQESDLIVPPSDSAALAKRIVELFDDPIRARAIGMAGREVVQKRFSVGQMVRETARLYRHVLENELRR